VFCAVGLLECFAMRFVWLMRSNLSGAIGKFASNTWRDV
jgi:hypothetical protein